MKIIEKIEGEQLKADIAKFRVGDTVKVHTRVREGDKDRVQIFTGVVIARGSRGINEKFTVRRISYGEGVERVFPLHSPRIAKIEVERTGNVSSAKLYYLRGRKGKDATTVREEESDVKNRNTKTTTAKTEAKEVGLKSEHTEKKADSKKAEAKKA